MEAIDKPYIGLGISNFQSIGNGKFRFPVGITAIVGASGSGKTALFRAFRAAILNPSSAKAYIKHGENRASVGLKIPGQPLITWAKERDAVFYKVGDDVRTKLGKKGIHSIIPDFPFPIEGETGRLMNFHTEWDILFPYKYTPSELFRLFEDVFDIIDSANVVKSIRTDEEGYTVRSVTHKTNAASIADRLSVIENEQAQISRKALNTHLERIKAESTNELSYKSDLEKATAFHKVIQLSIGLEPVAVPWNVVDTAIRATDDTVCVKKLVFSINQAVELKVCQVDLSLGQQARTLSEATEQVRKMTDFTTSFQGLEPFVGDIRPIEGGILITQDFNSAVQMSNRLESLIDEEQMIITYKKSKEEELEKFSSCPLCNQTL